MRRVLALSAAVVACFAAGGTWFAATEHLPVSTGWYWAVTTATTVGYGDVIPHDPAGRRVAVVMMLVAIPLLGWLFSTVTSLHVRRHLRPIENAAQKAHQIAADSYRHQTGSDHPDAPASREAP